LLYSCGSLLEGGSQLEDGELNRLCDLGLFWLSMFVFEVFSSHVFGSVEPSVHCLSGGVEKLSDAGDFQSFLDKFCEGSSDVG
jgi:hypothetical protein